MTEKDQSFSLIHTPHGQTRPNEESDTKFSFTNFSREFDDHIDKIDIERLRDRLVTDPEIIKYMNGQNTEENKKNFFKEQFDGLMVDYINERFEFYKKMDENPSVKNHIFKMMYENYSDRRVQP